MQDLYKLNQDKSYRILLIHGLFTSSGFWFGYLKYLKNFNISLININYLKFMEDEDYQSHILNILNTLSRIDLIISHSFGAIVSDTVNINAKRVNICPIHLTKLKNINLFKEKILIDTNFSSQHINLILNKVDTTLHNFKMANSIALEFFPSNDSYFKKLLKTNSNQFFFDGDHFDIKNALPSILKHLKL